MRSCRLACRCTSVYGWPAALTFPHNLSVTTRISRPRCTASPSYRGIAALSGSIPGRAIPPWTMPCPLALSCHCILSCNPDVVWWWVSKWAICLPPRPFVTIRVSDPRQGSRLFDLLCPGSETIPHLETMQLRQRVVVAETAALRTDFLGAPAPAEGGAGASCRRSACRVIALAVLLCTRVERAQSQVPGSTSAALTTGHEHAHASPYHRPPTLIAIETASLVRGRFRAVLLSKRARSQAPYVCGTQWALSPCRIFRFFAGPKATSKIPPFLPPFLHVPLLFSFVIRAFQRCIDGLKRTNLQGWRTSARWRI